MNRYYYVVQKLYRKSRFKATMKEIWGKKLKWGYIVLIGMSVSIFVLASSLFLQMLNKNDLWITLIAYVLIIVFSIAAIVLGKLNENDIRARSSWLIEINLMTFYLSINSIIMISNE